MRKALYIGQYSEGTTSKMRADILQKLLANYDFEVINTNIPFNESNKLLKSFTFRYKRGGLINKINRYITNNTGETYTLIWVDKGVYIKETTTKFLRDRTNKLVHFTPDPAFFFHQSAHFTSSISYYDFAITTKSFEIGEYGRFLKNKKILLATQGYDKCLHKRAVKFSDKKRAVLFIGHFEKQRGELVKTLCNENIPVTIAGKNWNYFIRRNPDFKQISYLGHGVYGENYAIEIGKHQFGLGLLSKRIPELHTTRTLEIPACGTALITERNRETQSIFNEDEVVFFDDIPDLVVRIKHLLEHQDELESITNRGHQKVTCNGYDYETILQNIFVKIGI